jgi:hypothetical protein
MRLRQQRIGLFCGFFGEESASTGACCYSVISYFCGGYSK